MVRKATSGHASGRRALAFTLAAGLLFATTARTAASAPHAHAPARSQAPVVVTVWQGWAGDEARAFHALVTRFNVSQSAIQVNTLDNVDYQKLLTSISGGTPPDIAELFSDYLGTFANNNVIQPLDALAGGSGIRLDAFSAQSLAAARYNGKLYGIPFMHDALALYWNKDLFKKAGLDPNRPPQTLGQLETAARKLEAVGSGGKIERLGIDPKGWLTTGLAYDFGGGFASPDGKRITANAPGVVKALAWELSFYHRLGAKNLAAFQSGEGQYASPANPFFRGQLGMTYDGEWLQSFIQRYSPTLHYGVAQLPYPDGMAAMGGTTGLGGGLWVVPKGSKHAAAAMTFIRWLAGNVGNQVDYANALANLPTLTAALDTPAFVSRHPYNKFFLSLATGRNAHYFPATAITTQYQTDLTSAEQDVLFGKTTPAAALAAVQSKDQQALDSALGKGGQGIP